MGRPRVAARNTDCRICQRGNDVNALVDVFWTVAYLDFDVEFGRHFATKSLAVVLVGLYTCNFLGSVRTKIVGISMEVLPVCNQPSPLQQGEANGFKEGHPKYGGRQKGSANRMGADLRQMIMNAAIATGHLEVRDGIRVGTGVDGREGFLKWLFVNEPKTAAAMLIRILPYYVNVEMRVGGRREMARHVDRKAAI